MEDGTYPARDFIPHSACGLMEYESLSLGMCHLPFSPHRITNNILPFHWQQGHFPDWGPWRHKNIACKDTQTVKVNFYLTQGHDIWSFLHSIRVHHVQRSKHSNSQNFSFKSSIFHSEMNFQLNEKGYEPDNYIIAYCCRLYTGPLRAFSLHLNFATWGPTPNINLTLTHGNPPPQKKKNNLMLKRAHLPL